MKQALHPGKQRHPAPFAVWAHPRLKPVFLMALRLLTLGSKFLLTLFIARFMGLEALGLYGFLLGATAVVPVLFTFGLMSLIGRSSVHHTPGEIVEELRHYWSLALALYLLLSPAVVLVPMPPTLALTALAVVVMEHLGTDTYNLLINRHRALLANLLLFVRGGGWMLLFMPLAYLKPHTLTLETLLAFWLAGVALSLIGFFLATRAWPWQNLFTFHLTPIWYRTHFKSSWKFFLGDICSFGGPYLDRYIIGLFFGLKEAGIYVLFWSVANALYTLISTGVMQINRPRLISAHKNNPGEYPALYAETQNHAQISALVLGLLAALALPVLLPYLGKPEATAALPVFFLLMAGLTIRTAADVAAAGLYTRHQDNALLATNLLGFAATAASTIIMVAFLGLVGAALAFALSYAFLFAIRTRSLRAGGLAWS